MNTYSRRFMIPLEPVYHNDYIKVEANYENSYLKVTWLKQPDSQIFKEETIRFSQHAVKSILNNILFDVRARTSLKEIDQNWLIRDIFPLFKNRSIRFAYLVSLEDFDIMDTYQIHDHILTNPKYSKQVTGMIFLKEEEAQNWLLEIGLYL